MKRWITPQSVLLITIFANLIVRLVLAENPTSSSSLSVRSAGTIAAAASAGSLVKYGKLCKVIEDFVSVNEKPQTTPAPYELTIFEIPGSPSNAYTLHVVAKRRQQAPASSIPIQYVTLMAINEQGLPTGHFHVFPCGDAKTEVRPTGQNHLDEFCTQRNVGTEGPKYGNTRLMYTTLRPNHGGDKELGLGDVSTFWTWHSDLDGPVGGGVPKKIQFRATAIQNLNLKGGDTKPAIFWVDILSPVIDMSTKTKFKLADPMDTSRSRCWSDELTSNSDGNFVISDDQSELLVNQTFMGELFPEDFPLIVPTTSTIMSTTKSKEVSTPSMVSPMIINETIFKITTMSTPSNIDWSTFMSTDFMSSSSNLITLPTQMASTSTYFNTTIDKMTPLPHIFTTIRTIPTESSKWQTLDTTTTMMMTEPKDFENETLGPAGPLVVHGLFCRNPNFELKGTPQKSQLSFRMEIYEILEPASANSLHIVVKKPTNFSYQHLIIMAIDEKGIPTGHFHANVCPDPNLEEGRKNRNNYAMPCTLKDRGHGVKWGTTRMMSSTFNPKDGNKALGAVSLFWSWTPKDGDVPPKKIQFRYAPVQTVNDHDGPNIYWVDLLSPVIEFRQKIAYHPPEIMSSKAGKCYQDVVSKDSTRNFVIAEDQRELKVSREFIEDLYPELGPSTTADLSISTKEMSTSVSQLTWTPSSENFTIYNSSTTTIPLSTWQSPSTTMEPSISQILSTTETSSSTSEKTYTSSSTEWPNSTVTTTQLSTSTHFKTQQPPSTSSTIKVSSTSLMVTEPKDFENVTLGPAGPLVVHGHFCRNPNFELKGTPQKSQLSFRMEIYEILEPASANTLHIVVKKPTNFSYQHLIIMAIDEKGIPTGHFHANVCPDPNLEEGRKNRNNYAMPCTLKDRGRGVKWGTTRIMSSSFNPKEGNKALGTVSLFWSWTLNDGDVPPKKIQFRYAVIQTVYNEQNIFWIDLVSPVIIFRQKFAYKIPNIMLNSAANCYANILSKNSDRNFILSEDQKELKVGRQFIGDLYPELVPQTTTIGSVSTEKMTAPASSPTSSTSSTTRSPSTMEFSTTNISSTSAPKKFSIELPKSSSTSSTTDEEWPDPWPTLFISQGLDDLYTDQVDDTTTEKLWPNSTLTTSIHFKTQQASTSKTKMTEPPESENVTLGPAGPLVIHGHFCRNPNFVLEGKPQKSQLSFRMEIYEILEPASANTLHIVVKKPTNFSYQHLVMMAIDEKGVPTGHFHGYVCPDQNLEEGRKSINNYAMPCTLKNQGHGVKWGPTRMMTSSFNPFDGNKELGNVVSMFWSWANQSDGDPPKKFQFLYAIIKTSEHNPDILWVNLDSPVIDLRHKIKPSFNPRHGSKERAKCYRDILSKNSKRNFVISEDQNELDVSRQYIEDLYPELVKNWITPPKRMVNPTSRQLDSIETDTTRLPLPPVYERQPSHYLRQRCRKRDSVPILGSIYSGCKSQKGCFGDVPGCTQRRTCGVMTTYSKNGDQGQGYYRFEMMTRLSQGHGHGYVATGFSWDRLMGDDGVVECVVGSDGSLGIFVSWNSEHTNKRLMGAPCKIGSLNGPLTGCNVTFVDGIILCNFYIKSVFRVNDHEFNFDKHNLFILQAVGSQIGSDYHAQKEKMRGKATLKSNFAHDRSSSSVLGQWKRDEESMDRRMSLDTDDEDTEESGELGNLGMHSAFFASQKAKILGKNYDQEDYDLKKLRLVKGHGVLMIMVWLFFIPNGHFMVRYFKESWIHVIFFKATPYWLLAHFGSLIFSAVLITISMILILHFSLVGNEEMSFLKEEQKHLILGFVNIGLFLVQLLVGLVGHCRISRENIRVTRVFEIFDFFLSIVSYILALLLLLRAHLMTSSFFACETFVIIFVHIFFILVWHVVMSIHLWLKDRSLGLKTCRAFIPWPIPVKMSEEMPGRHFRICIFALHVATTGIFSVILIIPYLSSREGCSCFDKKMCIDSPF